MISHVIRARRRRCPRSERPPGFPAAEFQSADWCRAAGLKFARSHAVKIAFPLGHGPFTPFLCHQREDVCSLCFCIQLLTSGSDCKDSACSRPGFDPWVGKIPWRREWQPTPVLLSGESYGQRSLAGYSVYGVTKSRTRLSD